MKGRPQKRCYIKGSHNLHSSHLPFAMVQDVIILLLVSGCDALESDEDGVNSLNLDLPQGAHALHGVDHISDALKTLAERVKLAEDVVLTMETSRLQLD